MPDDKKEIDKEVNKLTALSAETEALILVELNKMLLNPNKSIINQSTKLINDYITNYQNQLKVYIETKLPDIYKMGIVKAEDMIKKNGSEVINAIGFQQIHNETLTSLGAELFENYNKSVANISSNINQIKRQLEQDLTMQKTGMVDKAYIKSTAETVKQRLLKRGVTGFVDKAGKTWNMKTYSEMLSETMVVKTYRQALFNTLITNNQDLVRIVHLGISPQCPLCKPWNNKIVSLTGKTKGYPTINEATNTGLFHVRCDHIMFDIKGD
jgi:hypothetical protein